ncbi:MAG: PAS domain S-box protein, partial [Cytophagales bacterium]|nr:PAS domain S-box protein [Cytophagales bacterium]
NLFILNLRVWTDVILRFKNHNGVYKWVKLVANPRFSEDETFLGHIGICIDIDEQINAISEAKSTRSMLLNASANAKMAFYERNIATDKMVFSGAVNEMLDLEPTEKPTFDLFFKLMKDEYKDLVFRAIEKLRKSGKEFNVVYEIITNKGNRKILRALGGTERVNKVNVKNYGIIFDITEDYVKSEQLIKIKENLSAVFENSSDSFVLIDKDRKIEFFNKSAYYGMIDLFNVHMKLNKPIIQFVPEEDKQEFEAVLTKVFDGELASVERRYKSKYGEKWFRFRFFPIKTDEVVTKVSFVATDFTELKLKELENERLISELRLHNEELLQFSYIVSHNLRGPVANIIGLTDMLKESNSTHMHQEIVKMLGIASANLDKVIYDLNEILSLKRNTKDFDKVDLGEIFEAAKQLCQKTILDQNPIIKANFKALPHIYSVKGYVLSFFYNFLSNSLKYRN